MAYMTVLKKTESQLQLLREPTLLSKTIFVGFLVGVTGVILFGSESFLFKVFIGICAIFMSCFMVDNYEICDVNKTTSEVHLTKLHFCQYFLGDFLVPQPYVTCKLDDIQNVRVDEQVAGDSKKSYRVVLELRSGIPLGITEVFTNGPLSDYEKMVESIVSFIGVQSPFKMEDDVDYEGDGSSSDDEDDFEQISKADIDGIEEQMGGSSMVNETIAESNTSNSAVSVEGIAFAQTETGPENGNNQRPSDGGTAVL